MGFSSPGFLAAVQFRKGRRRGGRKGGGIIEECFCCLCCDVRQGDGWVGGKQYRWWGKSFVSLSNPCLGGCGFLFGILWGWRKNARRKQRE
jgi:hypothetical protein